MPALPVTQGCFPPSSSACAHREQGYAPQPSSPWAARAQVPLDGSYSLEIVLGVWLCACSSPSLRSWSRGDEDGGCSHVSTVNGPTLACSCLGAEPCFPCVGQPTSLSTAPAGGKRPWCCLEMQQHLRKGFPAYGVEKPALLRALPESAESGPTSWCREGLPAACHDSSSHIPITKILAQVSALLSLGR